MNEVSRQAMKGWEWQLRMQNERAELRDTPNLDERGLGAKDCRKSGLYRTVAVLYGITVYVDFAFCIYVQQSPFPARGSTFLKQLQPEYFSQQ